VLQCVNSSGSLLINANNATIIEAVHKAAFTAKLSALHY
jgi:hypothetical protein